MSQDYDIPLVGDYNGAQYGAKIKGTVDALKSGHLGATRPAYAEQGTFWCKYVNSTTIEVYFFDGSSDILQAIYNPTTHALSSVNLPANGVAIGKLEQIATARLLGRSTAGSGSVEVLTAAQVMAMLPDFQGDSGAGGVAGRVPAPGAGDGAAGYVLYADGSWGAPASGMPAGAVAFTAADSAPTGWLLAYGQEISRSTYAALFAAIGTTYGAGNGSTTFRVPDLRGRVVAGQDDMGGVSANRLTGLSGGVDGDTLGATGGAEAHQLTTPQLPAHSHAGPNGLANNAPSGGGTRPVASNTSGASTTGSAGGNEPHNNVQPTIILNGIIKI
jgi:microcystin-dependent protein